MKAGSVDLLRSKKLLAASSSSFSPGACLDLLEEGAFSSSSSSPSSAVQADPSRMRRGEEGSEAGSMSLPSARCGLGTKYLGFMDIPRCCFLFLFLLQRGALT